MIPGHQRGTILQRVVEQKEQEANELTTTKCGHMRHAKLLPHTRDDQEESYRNQHHTLIEWPHQECRAATKPGEQEVQGASLVPALQQEEEQEGHKKEARRVGEVRGSIEQKIGRRESKEGSKQPNLGGIEPLPHGIEQQQRAGAEHGVDESWHTQKHADRQEGRPSRRIFAVVAAIIHDMDMIKELAMPWRGHSESPMAENPRLCQI